MISLFDIVRGTLTSADMLALCTHNKINQNDNNNNRPSNICLQCKSSLNTAFDFYNLMNESEFKFQRIASMQTEISDSTMHSQSIRCIKQESELNTDDIHIEKSSESKLEKHIKIHDDATPNIHIETNKEYKCTTSDAVVNSYATLRTQ